MTLTFENGGTERFPHEEWDVVKEHDMTYYHGKITEVRNEAEDETVVQGALRREQERREKRPKGRIQNHVQKLADQRVQAEADRILGAFTNLTEPNSPHKTHFMARLSDSFGYLASSQNQDALLDRLHVALRCDSLHMSGLTGEKGIFIFVKTEEYRAVQIKSECAAPKPSIKKQLALPPTQGEQQQKKPNDKEEVR